MRRIVIAGLIAGLVMTLIVIYFAPTLREYGSYFLPKGNQKTRVDSGNILELKCTINEAERSVAILRKSQNRFTPQASYLIIDTSSDRFQLMANHKILRTGFCSTGSYTLLKTEDQRQWIFRTPRGMFHIQEKLKAPVWKKPDWAFVEEGLPTPQPNSSERFEAGVLGDYALYLGRGYLIHGTLYQRFLGMPVTHGCIRLGDDDLLAVYNVLNIGSKVFIY